MFVTHTRYYSKKLSNITRKQYEKSLKNPRELQPLVEILQFIENRFLALESCEDNAPQNAQTKIIGIMAKNIKANYVATVMVICFN